MAVLMLTTLVFLSALHTCSTRSVKVGIQTLDLKFVRSYVNIQVLVVKDHTCRFVSAHSTLKCRVVGGELVLPTQFTGPRHLIIQAETLADRVRLPRPFQLVRSFLYSSFASILITHVSVVAQWDGPVLPDGQPAAPYTRSSSRR